jgi:hypothetical protein
MNDYDPTKIITAADEQAVSVNGFGSTMPELPVATEHPEMVLGAAFAGGFLLARILRRLGD